MNETTYNIRNTPDVTNNAYIRTSSFEVNVDPAHKLVDATNIMHQIIDYCNSLNKYQSYDNKNMEFSSIIESPIGN